MLMAATIQPIMFVLLFAYVFGASLGGASYREFLMAGIYTQTVAFNSAFTTIGMANDLQKGIIDRFRSLPMGRSSVLIGRALSDLAKNFILVVIVVVIGYVVGFRFQNGFVNAIGVVVLTLAVSFTFSWIFSCVGLSLKKVEAVQAASFTLIFPVVFVSSAFVPVAGMASALQPIARENPVTIWCNLARYLSLGDQGIIDSATHLPIASFETLLLKSVAWIALLLVIAVPLAIRLYRKLD
jgi:ABC-2 type transport system permease protein